MDCAICNQWIEKLSFELSFDLCDFHREELSNYIEYLKYKVAGDLYYELIHRWLHQRCTSRFN